MGNWLMIIGIVVLAIVALAFVLLLVIAFAMRRATKEWASIELPHFFKGSRRADSDSGKAE